MLNVSLFAVSYVYTVVHCIDNYDIIDDSEITFINVMLKLI